MPTALVIAIPEASPVFDDWRERTCADQPSIGIPRHVRLFIERARLPLRSGRD